MKTVCGAVLALAGGVAVSRPTFAAGKVVIAGNLVNVADDTFEGGPSDSTINGGSDRQDSIHGGGGDDNINGLGGDGKHQEDGRSRIEEEKVQGKGTIMVPASLPCPSSLTSSTPPYHPPAVPAPSCADTLWGDAGSDQVVGGQGNDVLFGGPGVDTLHGGSGNDTLHGGNGGDGLIGGEGSDRMYGEGGDDYMSGGEGNDRMEGGAGEDRMYGSDGNDLMKGGSGYDYMMGEAGNDHMEGGNGTDFMWGSLGNDTLLGGEGNDYLSGGFGNDIINGGNGSDSIWGGVGSDVLLGGNGPDSMSGSEGADAMYGGEGADFMAGGRGADVMFGGEGADSMSGGNGQDSIHGGGGGDYLYGSGGDDRLYGGGGGDLLSGGEGADVLVPGEGRDVLRGGEGADVFVIFHTSDDSVTNIIEDFNAEEGDMLCVPNGPSFDDLHTRFEEDSTTSGLGLLTISLADQEEVWVQLQDVPASFTLTPDMYSTDCGVTEAPTFAPSTIKAIDLSGPLGSGSGSSSGSSGADGYSAEATVELGELLREEEGLIFSAGVMRVVDTDAGGEFEFDNAPNSEDTALLFSGHFSYIVFERGVEHGTAFYYSAAADSTITAYADLQDTRRLTDDNSDSTNTHSSRSSRNTATLAEEGITIGNGDDGSLPYPHRRRTQEIIELAGRRLTAVAAVTLEAQADDDCPETGGFCSWGEASLSLEEGVVIYGMSFRTGQEEDALLLSHFTTGSIEVGSAAAGSEESSGDGSSSTMVAGAALASVVLLGVVGAAVRAGRKMKRVEATAGIGGGSDSTSAYQSVARDPPKEGAEEDDEERLGSIG